MVAFETVRYNQVTVPIEEIERDWDPERSNV